MWLPSCSSALVVLTVLGQALGHALAPNPPKGGGKNSTYFNPVLPGWHPDPSCVYVAEKYNSFFCVFSTFSVFPGLPLYTSKDLINWRLAANIFNRPTQVPWIANATGQQDGIFAPTIRYNEGKFYVITTYTTPGDRGLIFVSSDPYKNEAWSEPIRTDLHEVDPDLFWDDDGTVYVCTAGILQQTIDLDTGAISDPVPLWNGTGGPWPEGPHLHKRNGWYYLIISEGGIWQNHSITVARSRKPTGPFEAYENNPILTNKGTDEFLQAVGHSDVIYGPGGNLWGIALAKRSGPESKTFPMGREAVFFPVSWDGEWPVMEPVRSRMTGWPLPPQTRKVPGIGPFVTDGDVIDFPTGSDIPPHFVYWRFPRRENYIVSPWGHPNTLNLRASKRNLAGLPDTDYTDPITFIGRRQTATLFNFTVDLTFDPEGHEGAESGVTLFMNQRQHARLGVVLVSGVPSLRFGAVAASAALQPPEKTIPVPREWWSDGDGKLLPIRLQIRAGNWTHFEFSAASPAHPGETTLLGTVAGQMVSGSPGGFLGSLLGVYATTNGGNTVVESFVSRWRYTPIAQYLGGHDWVQL